MLSAKLVQMLELSVAPILSSAPSFLEVPMLCICAGQGPTWYIVTSVI